MKCPVADIWESPPELRRSLPRRVALTPRGVTYVALGAAFLIAALGVGWALDSQGKAWARVEQQGDTTAAVITRVWINGGKSRTPMVSYRFTAGATEIAGKSSVSNAVWNGLHVGDPLTIRYAPLSPNLNHPAQGASRPAPAWLVFCVVVWPVIVFWAIVHRERRLLSTGVPAPATVVGIGRQVSGRGGRDRKFRVLCNFTPAGSGARMTATFNRSIAPEIGATLCLIYDPDNPSRNAVYPLATVRVRTG